MNSSLLRITGLILFLSIGWLSNQVTWDFSLARHRISSPLPLSTVGEFPPLLDRQTWFLAAEGGQSYVFFSQDGSYVLKFFKDQPRPWLQWPSYQALKNKKLLRTLTGYSLLMQRCPAISGLQFLHFQPTAFPLPATLIDRLGIAHTVDLKSYLFVLQQRAEPLKSSSSPEEKQRLLMEASHLLQDLSKAYLKDHDPRLHLNLGYINGKLIVLDPGRIADSQEMSTSLPDKFTEFLQ